MFVISKQVSLPKIACSLILQKMTINPKNDIQYTPFVQGTLVILDQGKP